MGVLALLTFYLRIRNILVLVYEFPETAGEFFKKKVSKKLLPSCLKENFKISKIEKFIFFLYIKYNEDN